MATRTGTPSTPSVLAAAAFAAAAAAAARNPQPADGSRGVRKPPGRRTTQTFKAESLVRQIDCPVDQQARHPPIGHRKRVTAPCSLAGASAYALEPTEPVTSAH